MFDKAYLLEQIELAFSQFQLDELAVWENINAPKIMDFELEADKLLRDGGTKNKDIKLIMKTSKIVQELIDNKLEEKFSDCKLRSDFFISSSFIEIWNKNIVKQSATD